MTLLDVIAAELTRRGDGPLRKEPQPPAARLRRLGAELAVPVAGVVDGEEITVTATLDRCAVVADSDGVRRLVLLDAVLVSDVGWQRPFQTKAHKAAIVAGERGRAQSMAARR